MCLYILGIKSINFNAIIYLIHNYITDLPRGFPCGKSVIGVKTNMQEAVNAAPIPPEILNKIQEEFYKNYKS